MSMYSHNLFSPLPMGERYSVAAVVIGRNEGQRLVACLDSLVSRNGFEKIVYVDSGSTDGSQDSARAKGVDVVPLDMSVPFTAARARNAGIAHLQNTPDCPDLIQFLDGDCILQEGWLPAATTFLEAHPKVAVVCGRRRELHPQTSIWNQLIDAEWDTPIGEARACGGDALMRFKALEEVGGYDPTLIAGEEPELCVRLRGRGWNIWRLDAEMTLHDAAMTKFGQWWQRTKRGGHAYAEGAAMHGTPPERHKVAELRRAVLWGLCLPALTFGGALLTPWALLLLLVWPLQMIRLRRHTDTLAQAVFLTLAKLPEAQGVLAYIWRRFTKTRPTLIEYK